MTSLPLISHRMFVAAAIQDETGARPARPPSKTLDAPPSEPRVAAAGVPDSPAVAETASHAEPVTALGS